MKNATLMLQSGVEMVEILHELNMDAETLLTAMLFPIVANKLTDWESLKKNLVRKLLNYLKACWRWIIFANLMPVIHNALQVDNVRRMLLAMVDDFRA